MTDLGRKAQRAKYALVWRIPTGLTGGVWNHRYAIVFYKRCINETVWCLFGSRIFFHLRRLKKNDYRDKRRFPLAILCIQPVRRRCGDASESVPNNAARRRASTDMYGFVFPL